MRVQASIGAGIEGHSHQATRPQEVMPDAHKANLPVGLAASPHPGLKRSFQTRPLAAVLAQLTANANDYPWTRARRRAEPEEAASLYGLAAAVTPPAHKSIIRIL